MTGAAGRALAGAVAGAAATVPMSAWMVALERLGAMRGLPPEAIVSRTTPAERERTVGALAAASHLVYGAAAGAVLALLPVPRPAVPAAGALYGLGLWAVGYEGWVPALRVLPPAHRDEAGRVGTMVSAHLVYGLALGAGLLALRRRA